MEFYQFIDVDIRHTVSICQKERFTVQMFFYPFDSSAGHRIQSGIYNGYFPRFRDVVVHRHFISLRKVKCHVTAVQVIICEPFFDHMLLVSTADHKFIVSIVGIKFHDMPENRFVPDFYHGLWFQYTFFADAGAETTCKYYYFHVFSPCLFRLKGIKSLILFIVSKRGLIYK